MSEADSSRNGEGTLANICIRIASELVKDLGIANEATDDLLTFAIDLDSEFLASMGPELVEIAWKNPAMVSLCHTTADRIFPLFAQDTAHSSYEFNPQGSPDEHRPDVGKLLRDLAARIGRSAKQGNRFAYKIKYANHQFVVIVRNCAAEIFQSFACSYGFGCSLRDRPFSPGDIQVLLAALIAPKSQAGEVQECLFHQHLANDIPHVVFQYTEADLFDDETIEANLRQRMVKGLRDYKAMVERYGSGRS